MSRGLLVFGAVLGVLANIAGYVLLAGTFGAEVGRWGIFALLVAQAVIVHYVLIGMLFGWVPHAWFTAVRRRIGIAFSAFIIVFLIGAGLLILGFFGAGFGIVIAIAVLITLLVATWVGLMILAIR